MTIGDKIRTLRKEKHLTQAQVVENSVSQNMLCLIENGKASPSVETLFAIAKKLGVPASYFLDENDLFFYKKQDKIRQIRNYYQEKKFRKCLLLLNALPGDDDETAWLKAYSSLYYGIQSIQNGNIGEAERMLNDALLWKEKTVYDTARIDVLYALYYPVCKNMQAPLLDFDSKEYADACAVSDDADFYHYLIMDGKHAYKNPVYADHIKAKLLYKGRKYKEAIAILKKLEDTRMDGVYDSFVVLGVFTDMELCYKEICDFEKAYQYSQKRLSMTGSFNY